MSDAPERIWLQDDGEWCEDSFLSGEISWCDCSVNEHDTEYLRRDLSLAHVAAKLEKAAAIMDQEAAYWSDLCNDDERVSWEQKAKKIRALIPTDAQAALDAVRAEEREAERRRGLIEEGRAMTGAVAECIKDLRKTGHHAAADLLEKKTLPETEAIAAIREAGHE